MSTFGTSMKPCLALPSLYKEERNMYKVVDYFFIEELINLIYSWDSRILPSNLLLLSKYCFKNAKLVGFTRLISYFSFYYSYLALFGILLSPSPKP